MEIEKIKSIIEAMLFAAGKEVPLREIAEILDIPEQDAEKIISVMREEYKEEGRGIEIIKAENTYMLGTKKEYYDYIYPLFDNRSKPSLSNAALETLSIIAYNPKVTRAEIEQIRGVSSDASIYKLLEYNLIQDAGKLDAPGRPTTYEVTSEFFKMFGIESLEALPELPRYKIDENEQIVIDDLTPNETAAPKEDEFVQENSKIKNEGE